MRSLVYFGQAWHGLAKGVLNNMRVIYLHQFFNTPVMCGGVRSYDIASYLVKNGHAVNMVTSAREGEYEDRWTFTMENGINTHWLSLPYSNKLNYLERLKSFYLFAFYSAKKGSSLEGDIIYASSTPLTIAIPALYISWKKSIPIVFEVRDLWPEVPISIGALKNSFVIYLAKTLERYIYKKSKAVVALSQGMKNGVVNAGCDEKKVFVIPNFSNIKLFNSGLTGKSFRANREWLADSPLLVYTGTFGLINGISYLVDIAEKLSLSNSNVKILLLGHGREFNSVESYAKKKGVLNNNLFIEPSVKKEELPEVLAAADLSSNIVINVPELWNNSANKFFDSLASGTPVLVNGMGWQADLINKRNSGIVTYGMSLEQSAKVINDFLNNKDLLKESSKNALNLSKKCFDKDKLVKRVEEILYFSLEQKKDLNTLNFKKKMIGLKYFFDLLVIFLSLPLVFLVFFLVAILVLVKSDSKVFFKQARPGLNGNIFNMYKFQTMTDERDENGRLKSDSIRLTKFGKFLRSTSLDELPGLWSVIKGDMSLVGPRPLLVEYLPFYSKKQYRRHEVKPGITGWAQVNGRNAISWDEKFKLDVWYVDNQSIWLDVKILWLTVKKVISRDGVSPEGIDIMPRFDKSEN